MTSNLLAVAITTYHDKARLNADESASLSRLRDLTSSLPGNLYIVGPEDMDYSEYRELGFTNFIHPGARFFGSIERYNRMMLSAEFYRQFSGYEYVLIHHPDAYLFKGNIDEWCSKSYDYIGAPWKKLKLPKRKGMVKTYLKKDPLLAIKVLLKFYLRNRKDLVGNGGLCLRKVDSTIRVLGEFEDYAKIWNYNEDVFLSCIIPMLDSTFTVADAKTASLFAIEEDPDYFRDLNGGQIPTGCHGWQKAEIEPWQSVGS